MVSILENFFYDQRPKIAIFPKAAICSSALHSQPWQHMFKVLHSWTLRYPGTFLHSFEDGLDNILYKMARVKACHKTFYDPPLGTLGPHFIEENVFFQCVLQN